MIHTAFAATYTVKSLFQSIITVIVNPLVIFLSALAIMLFLWGLLQFMANAGGEEGSEMGKRHMVNGLIGLFIMISVYGIMRVITNTFGFKKPDTTNLESKGRRVSVQGAVWSATIRTQVATLRSLTSQNFC
jgi:phosphotransferase system  glucose/maltose/N-acetylglucosamine-specific IIC component